MNINKSKLISLKLITLRLFLHVICRFFTIFNDFFTQLNSTKTFVKSLNNQLEKHYLALIKWLVSKDRNILFYRDLFCIHMA